MIGPIAWPFVSHRKYAVPSSFSNEWAGGCEFFRNDWLAGGSACPQCLDAAILILSRQVFCGCRWGGWAEMWDILPLLGWLLWWRVMSCCRFPADVFGGEPRRADVACWGGWGPHTPCARQIGPHPPQPTPPSRHGSLRCVWVRRQQMRDGFGSLAASFFQPFADQKWHRVLSEKAQAAIKNVKARTGNGSGFFTTPTTSHHQGCPIKNKMVTRHQSR